MSPFAPSPSSVLISVVVAAFVAWRLQVRIRRLVGRQACRPRRFWITVVVVPPLLVLLFFISLSREADNALAMLAGLVAGVTLGVCGLRLTHYESTDEGLFYTPNTYIGIGLSLLFLGRIAYRLGELWWFKRADVAMSTDFARSPLTLAIFATLAGHYFTYAVGILRWHRRARRRGFAPPAV